MRMLLACALLAAGFAPAPLPRSERRDSDSEKVVLARLQGTWMVTRYMVGLDERPTTTRCVVEGARATYFEGGTIQSQWTLELDVRARPNRMYFEVRPGSTGESHDCVFQLSGNRLVLCCLYWEDPSIHLKDCTPAPGRIVTVLARVAP